MKKKIALGITLLFLVLRISAQENRIILMHPTAYNLTLFTYLVDQHIIDIDNLKITGVYHKKETYNYSESESFLVKNDYPYIELLEVTQEILPEELFQVNTCTSIFNYLFKSSKGIIFFGGPDLPPQIYGEQMSLLTQMTDPYRHFFEASFLFHLLGGSQNSTCTPLLEENPGYTVYTICLGMQTMNIATGGTMCQDIPSEIYGLNYVEEALQLENNKQHRNYYNNLSVDSTLFAGNFHRISITDYYPLTKDYNENLQPLVYSNHHQAIEDLGKNLEVIATSTDGKIVEAIKHKKYPNVLGIQFHPEGKYLHDPEIKYRKSPNDELISGKQILSDNKSYEFHLQFWKTFSDKINQNSY